MGTANLGLTPGEMKSLQRFWNRSSLTWVPVTCAHVLKFAGIGITSQAKTWFGNPIWIETVRLGQRCPMRKPKISTLCKPLKSWKYFGFILLLNATFDEKILVWSHLSQNETICICFIRGRSILYSAILVFLFKLLLCFFRIKRQKKSNCAFFQASYLFCKLHIVLFCKLETVAAAMLTHPRRAIIGL